MPSALSFADHGLPFLYAVVLWWSSTGLVLYLDGLPERTYRRSLLGATVLLGLALLGLVASRGSPTAVGAGVAFTCAVLVWGWNEMAFLMGFVTGPRREACPEGCRGPRHVGHAIAAILWHELALIVSGVVVLFLVGGAANPVAAWTFLVLWSMRLSTKLNVFLGVPNLSEEFLPDHLQYLRRYFTRRPMNLLFPLSVTGATVATALLVQWAVAPGAGAFEAVGYSLVGTLMALAVLEHWFLVLPLPSASLWSWGLRSRARGAPPGAPHLSAPSAGPPPRAGGASPSAAGRRGTPPPRERAASPRGG